MKQFFKTFLATLLAILVAGALMVGVFVAVIVGLASSAMNEAGEVVKIDDNSVLHLTLDKEIRERSTNNPLEGFDFGSFSSNQPYGLDEILNAISKAKSDEKIKGILLDVSSVGGGLATIEEIRNALIDYKESGKWLISYSEGYSQSAYYLCSVADQIYVYPEGDIDFKGLNTELAFFKGLLEKLEIEPQIIRGRNNKFKSAVEPFMYDQMSDANREQVSKYLNSIWGHWLNNISAARKISVADLNLAADSLRAMDGNDAVAVGLADKVMYRDELTAEINSRLKQEENDKISFVSLRKYGKTSEKISLGGGDKEKVAIVYAVGDIESGKGDEQTIGSETISKAIRKARLDDKVKAVVLRVNSPGGSALASDVIWREVVLTKKVKPVVVSMGNLAASGGYYISCAANKIYAEPTTITGSIGVFGIIPNMQKFFNNKMGVTFDGVKTNAHTGTGMVFKPLDSFEHKKIQLSVEKIYDAFIGKVADGRGMTKEAVDSIGQGRVWTGLDAKELGLVDEIGGLDMAVEEAAKLANLSDYDRVNYPEQKDPFEQIVSEITGDMEDALISSQVKEFFPYLDFVHNMKKMETVQARIPYTFTIE